MLGVLCVWKIFIPIVNSVYGFQVMISQETVFLLLDSTSGHKVTQLHFFFKKFLFCFDLIWYFVCLFGWFYFFVSFWFCFWGFFWRFEKPENIFNFS